MALRETRTLKPLRLRGNDFYLCAQRQGGRGICVNPDVPVAWLSVFIDDYEEHINFTLILVV